MKKIIAVTLLALASLAVVGSTGVAQDMPIPCPPFCSGGNPPSAAV